MTIIEEIEKKHMKKDLPSFRVGDTVRVHVRIIEGNKERIQVFEGIVIGRQGSGLAEAFSVYRHAYGSSMERLFLLHSPKIQKIEVIRSGKTKRAKLYYLRGKTGKKAKVKELLGKKVRKEKTDRKEKAETPNVTIENEPSS